MSSPITAAMRIVINLITIPAKATTILILVKKGTGETSLVALPHIHNLTHIINQSHLVIMTLATVINVDLDFSMKKVISVVVHLLLVFGFYFSSFPAFSWDGYDYQNGSYVEIGKGNLVRYGKEIEIYDYSTGEYKDVEVESIRGNGFSTEVEVYDPETGENRTFDMDN